jgi:hypothetical protein
VVHNHAKDVDRGVRVVALLVVGGELEEDRLGVVDVLMNGSCGWWIRRASGSKGG